MFCRFSAGEQLQLAFTPLFKLGFLDAWLVIMLTMMIMIMTVMRFQRYYGDLQPPRCHLLFPPR